MDPGTHPLLQVDNLSVAFSSDAGRHLAVDGIRFSIAPGESFALVGESGSGKSVTSLAILRLLDPRSHVTGSILFQQEDWLRLPEHAMVERRGRDVAMIFQEPMTALNPVMPIGRQIEEAVRVHHKNLSRGDVRQRVLNALMSVSLPDPLHRFHDYPHQFSGGQRQRIMIAMAMINRPSLLIADEPTTALDVTVQAQILELLRELKEQSGTALLFISHDLSVVAQVAQRVAVMRRGKIVEMGACTQIFTNPQHSYTRSLLAAVPTLRSRRDAPLAVQLHGEVDDSHLPLVEVSTRHWARVARTRAE